MDETEIIVKYNGELSAMARALGASAELLGDNYAIMTLRERDIPRLYETREIEYIELPKLLVLSNINGMAESCVAPVRDAAGLGLSGGGVLVGVIDSGVDYTHPDFIDGEGNSRVLFLWDQTKEGNSPEGFLGGTEYSGGELGQYIKNKQGKTAPPSLDDAGHGTPVAGIAAGNGRASGGKYKGVAPDASIIAVKLGERGRKFFSRTTEIMRALKYVVDKAEQLGMPVAVNLSFGTNNGSHTGTSLFETYIDAVSRRWKSVVVAATGNEGAAGHHYYGRAGNGETADASFAVAGGLESVYLTLWKSFADTFDITIKAPGGEASGVLPPEAKLTRISLAGTTVSVYGGQPSFYNENQEIFIRLDGGAKGVVEGVWQFIIKGRRTVLGDFHIWLPTLEEAGAGTAFLAPDPNMTMTLPSTAENVLSVGGYNSATGAAAAFSGRGRAYISAYSKPDIAAPAINIVSASAGGGYGAFTGTSMAAPFVCGAAALMMEWGIVQKNDPFLYGQRVKAFLRKNAARNNGAAYPNSIFGYGTLCLKAAMDDLMRYR